MGKYQGYERYKDSGVKWLGEIPEHWSVSLLKRYCSVTDGSHFSPNSKLTGMPYISVKDIGANTIDLENCKKISEEDFELLVRNGCSPKTGDVLLTKDGTIGRAAIVTENYNQFVVLSSLGIISPKNKLSSKFLYFYLISGLNIQQMYETIHGSALTRLTIEKINKLIFVHPPLDEQESIARFLNYKTKQIDDLITKKETLIEKLDEKRTALISHAVTKGLDPNVPMKDSGIEWLGKVPKHWEVMHLKRKAQVRGGVAKGRKLDKEETVELPYLRVANVQDGYIDISDISCIEVLHDEVERYLLNDGDVLMNEGGDNDKLGRGAVWNAEINPCLHQNHVFAVRPNNKDLSSWIALLTSSSYAKFYFFSRAKQSTNLASISSTNIKLFPAIFPPESQRQAIINHISNSTSKIDQQKAKIQQAIELLKEYRTALITNAVTGKIDVRQVPIP